MSGICPTCGEVNPAGGACPRCGVGAAQVLRGFIGREHELGVLRSALDAACAGDGRMVLIAGEPGIGKTRLVEELVAAAEWRGARVLSAGCHEDAGAPAYWPWVQMIRAYVRTCPGDALAADLGAGAAEIAQVVAEVRERLPETPFPVRSEPGEDRFRLFEAVAAFLGAAGARQPLVIVLEDVHWADAPTLALLRHVGRTLAGTRVLLVVTHRDVDPEPGQALMDALIELRRQRGTERVDLRGLSAAEVESLMAALLSGAEHGDRHALAAAVHRETEGNPLFVEEVVRGLVEAGQVARGKAGWTAGPGAPASFAVPESVQQLIGRRLARLSEPCRGLLAQAAVLGREFTFDLLARMTEMDDDALLAAVEEAVAARVLMEDRGRTEPVYVFGHALIRRTLYDGLTLPRRQRLHLRAAEAIEALYAGNPDREAAALALHYRSAGGIAASPDKAIHYAVHAAEAAAVVFAWEEAARLYALAVQALDRRSPPNERQQCELLVLLANAQFGMGDFPLMRLTLRRAIEIGRRIDAAGLLAQAALLLGRDQNDWARPDEQIIRLFEEVLGRLGEGDRADRAELMARLAAVYAFDPHRRPEADPLVRRALAMARRVGDPATLVESLRHAFLALSSEDDQRAAAVEAVHTAEEHHLAFGGWQTRMWLIQSYLEDGDMAALDQELATIGRITANLHAPFLQFFYSLSCATRMMSDGRFDETERLVEEMRTATRRFQNANASAQLGEIRYCLDRERGRLAGMVAGLERAVAQNRNVMVQAMLAFAHADLGQIEEARRAFEALTGDSFAEVRADRFWKASLGLLAEVCGVLGDSVRAELVYELLLPLGEKNIIHGDLMFLGAATRHLGILAGTMQHWDDAERHFADALAMNERQGAVPWTAWTRHDHARMLLARDAPGDRAWADALLAEALAAARDLGMVRLEKAAHTLAEQATQTSPQSQADRPTYPDGLSAREVEILRLVAGGRSNREIADALVLSVRTVERHIENIYAKLGVHGKAARAAVATYAARHGLLPKA